MQDFTKMRCWVAARDLFVETYEVTKRFPKSELFGFVSPMRGASRSIAANIAEGAGYTGELDSARF
jgi:four helix bundle protein